MFAEQVIAWQRAHGRHDLPWQADRDPYRIWVSEIMLQQTQVGAVLGYFERFLRRFPELTSLAQADLDEVLELWSGLGYYSRARNLHACARRIVAEHGGRFPRSAQALAELPGIGRSTAAAIAAFAFGERVAILDGNVRRVLCRVFGVEGYPAQPAVERRLWDIAEGELPARDIEAYTQGLMDLGATLCTRARPGCDRCPLAQRCVAFRDARVHALPAPRPRKVSPLRETAVLVLRRDRRVLVERRPTEGIWGGLWSLPELPDVIACDAQALRAAVDAMGWRMSRSFALPPFLHAFTHFRLELRPYLVELDQSAREGQLGARRWLSPEELAGAALPAPIKTLLRSLDPG